MDSISAELRSSLWNLVNSTDLDGQPEQIGLVVAAVNSAVIKRPLDEFGHYWGDQKSMFRTWFFECDWHQLYDALEVLVAAHAQVKDDEWLSRVNRILAQENAAYRAVGTQIVPVINDSEIAEITSALEGPSAVGEHFREAVRQLADRKATDFRNAVKEAILGVEAAARIVTGKPKATLGDALKAVGDLHPALREGFSRLYGYSSDGDGIRHAISGTDTGVSRNLAQYMIVSCSAFANYLLAQSS